MTTPKAKLAGLALIAALCAGFTLGLTACADQRARTGAETPPAEAVRPSVNPADSAAISARPANLAFGVVKGFLPGEVATECTASRIEYQSRSRGR